MMLVVGIIIGVLLVFVIVIPALAWNMQESGKFYVKEGKNYKPFKSPFAGD